MASSKKSKCQLTEWGLPPLIIGWFKKKGISSLFEWQVECLCEGNVLNGENLVYSAPTSAGKTLVADFLLLKKVLEHNKKALVIEPFVALTREKATTLKSMLYNTKARVGAFGGSYYTPGGMATVNVAVCTIEKANNFINKLINENKISDLGVIIVDEIHYIGDERRGYQLELLLTKVLYYNSQQDKSKKIQIVGLSATIPNLESIAKWLQASLYITGYRPVPLVEKIKIANKIYEASTYLKDPSCEPVESICPGKLAIEKDYDDLCYICINSIIDNHSTLVFCESKRECELMAANLSQQIRISGNKLQSENFDLADISKKLRENLSSVKICDVIDKLKKCPAGPDKELIKSLNMGVAFHHAGLTSEEREIIEDGFKSGAIKTLMATSTLSSGVNLPARKVVIRSPTMIYSAGGVYQKVMLNPASYKQMVGRAGRKNIDSCGESILICNNENQDLAIQLIKASLGNITSALANRMIASEGGEPSGLKKAVLEVIASNTTKTKSSLDRYLRSTFWLSSISKEDELTFKCAVTETLRYLVSKKFIEELKPGEYRATRLGKAVLSSGLHPDESLELLQDLVEARKGFCLLNDLHIIYQVTPNDIARSIELKDWHNFSRVWNELDEVCRSVGERVGIDEFIIVRRCQGSHISLSDARERVYRRFWIALAINDIIQEISLPKICSKYHLSKATVQQAQRAVAQFAGVMSIFCNELGYDNIAALVTPLETRINFSCQRDLLDLIRLNVTRPIARALFNAGYRNVIAVAKAEKLDIEFIIRQIKPFKRDISFNADSDYAPSMWVPELAKSMTTLDYASHIVETAISFVEIEYDIDLNGTRVENESNTGVKVIDEDIIQAPASKRGRLGEENGKVYSNILVS